MINYFNFKKFNNKYLITNDLGRYLFADKKELFSLINNQVDMNSDFGKSAEKNMFCYNGSPRGFAEKVKPYFRDSKNYLFSSTGLHIFVVTKSCNLKCVYCQTQNGNEIPNGFMTEEIAERAVDIALTSPNDNLSFEFQGGEPLANFSVIQHIVEYTELNKRSKYITYNIVTNLTLITQDIVDFIKKYNVGISTSIDGNELVHNMNRRYRNGKGSYSDVKHSIELLKVNGVRFGAIQTTTSNSLPFYKEIIDEYISMGLKSIFIRPLTPLGCANKDWNFVGYSAEKFIEFYNKAFDYILQLNMNGTEISEGHATIFLSKILHGYPVNYMELRSPCGAGIGQIAYYFDGNVYTCDEGRMLAEMGDDSFKLGNVYNNTYDELINCNNCKAACISSVLESLPTCHDCVYSPYCGTCPVTNLALNKNIFNKEPNSYRCKTYRGILDKIFSALQNEKEKSIIEKW